MDYSIANRAARRNGPDVILPELLADESLIADPRGDVRPADIVEQRLQRHLGTAPSPLGETWNHRSRAKPGTLASETVGELIDTELSHLPPPSSFPHQEDERTTANGV